MVAREDLVRMTDFEAAMVLFNILIILSSITPMVFISNLTFTFTYLTTSQVPFYDSGLIWGLGSFWFDRFGFEWYIVISDFFYLVIPMFQIFILLNSNVQRLSDWRMFNLVVLGLTTLIKLFTAIWRAYQLWFCFDFNICRCYSPGCCTSRTDCHSNFDFQYLLGYNLAYLIILVIYGVIAFARLYQYNIEEQNETIARFSDQFERNNPVPKPYSFAKTVFETDRRNLPGVKKFISGVKFANKAVGSTVDKIKRLFPLKEE